MATNGANSSNDDDDMADCDSENVVTMMDVLKEQEEFEEDANAVLGASDDKNCTYLKGYVKRQAIYACLTCCPDAKSDPMKRAGMCLACSLNCHENHELVELYTKRNFRCDCGNPKFNLHPCQFTPNKSDLNYENKYNQNFIGVYCVCHRPYPDPEALQDDEMIQCIICEDWLHSAHLEATVPLNDHYAEMICKDCLEDNAFLLDYSDLAMNIVDKEITVTDPDLDVDLTSIFKKPAVPNCDSKVLVIGKKNPKPNDRLLQEDTETKKGKGIIQKCESPTNDERVFGQASVTSNNEGNKSEAPDTKNDTTEMAENKSVTNSDMPAATNTDGTFNEKSDNLPEEVEGKTNAAPSNKDEKKLDESLADVDMAGAKPAESGDDKVVPENREKEIETNSDVDKTDIDAKYHTSGDAKPDLVDEKGQGKDDEVKIDSIVQSVCKEEKKNQGESAEENTNKNDLNQDIKSDIPDPETLEKIEEDRLPLENPEGLEGNGIINQQNESPTSGQASVTSNNVGNKEDRLPLVDTEGQAGNGIINQQNESPTSDQASVTSNNEGNKEDRLPLEDTEGPEGNGIINQKNESLTSGQASATSNNEGNKFETSDTKKDISTTEIAENISVTDTDMTAATSTDNLDKENQISVDDKEIKRKLSTDEEIDDPTAKKPKLVMNKCVRPQGVKKAYKGAIFWPSNFRQKLCTCNECISMYKDLAVLFLIDLDDTVTAYEALGKERAEGNQSQYEKGLQALSSLDRVQQINALTEYNKMRDKLLVFLKSFKDRKEIVKEEDIKAFFAGIKPTREPDGVYFCR